MPLVNIQMAKGRSEEQKRAPLAAIAEAMHEHVGAPRDAVLVWITEFESTDFMAGGELLKDKQERLAREAAQQSADQNGQR